MDTNEESKDDDTDFSKIFEDEVNHFLPQEWRQEWLNETKNNSQNYFDIFSHRKVC